MMITTHVLFGLLLGAFSSSIFPLEGLVMFSVLGAIFPDMDMFFNHRKTFHRPFQFLILSVLFLPLFYLSPYFLLPAVFLISAVTHCFSDVFCNGKTMRPWKMQDDRAVFDHIRHKWIAPRRFFYDGSKTDLFIATVLSLAVIEVYGLLLEGSVLFSLSLLYSLLRRKVTEVFSGYERFSEVVRGC